MSTRQRLLGTAALLLATSGWGSMFLVSKGVLHHVESVWFTLIRYTLSALLFALLIVPRGAAPWRKLRLHAGPLALRGVAGFGVFSVMLLVGLAHSVPSHGAVIIATTPMTTQLVRWALDDARPSRTTLLTSALALLGVAIVSGLLFGGAAGASGGSTTTLFGDAIAFVGTLGWVWYTRGTTRFPELDVIEYTALTVLASWPVLLVAAVGAVTGPAFLNFVPVSALLVSAALGRLPTVNEAVGMAMVVAALLIHTAASRKASAAAAARIAPAPQNYRSSTCGATTS